MRPTNHTDFVVTPLDQLTVDPIEIKDISVLETMPAMQHDRMARDWLTPRFGERVGWLAGAHVAAKRYLVATDPDYANTLSDVSVDSLHHQGGAGVDASFIASPWWPDALRLRRYDDAAKDPQETSASIEYVLAVAERVLQQRHPHDRA